MGARADGAWRPRPRRPLYPRRCTAIRHAVTAQSCRQIPRIIPAVRTNHFGRRLHRLVHTDEPSDFMQYTAFLEPSRRVRQPEQFGSLRERLDFQRCAIPSVIHVDYSARLQTIRREIHPDMHRLLTAFKRQTGVPILINTSFNVSGQPIVRTAAEGWECFVNTDIDLLVLNDEVFHNPLQKTREEKLSWLKQFARSA